MTFADFWHLMHVVGLPDCAVYFSKKCHGVRRRIENQHPCWLLGVTLKAVQRAARWSYYGFYFGCSLDDSVLCAETAIQQSLQGLH